MTNSCMEGAVISNSAVLVMSMGRRSAPTAMESQTQMNYANDVKTGGEFPAGNAGEQGGLDTMNKNMQDKMKDMQPLMKKWLNKIRTCSACQTRTKTRFLPSRTRIREALLQSQESIAG